MKKNYFMIALVTLFSLAICPLGAQNVNQDCKVGEFSAINLQSVGDINFTQSDRYSCRMEGPLKSVEKTSVEVKGGTLIITHKGKDANKTKDLTLHITAPDLNNVVINGVGNFIATTPLQLKNLALILNGVGDYEVKKLRCEKVELVVNGVGNMDINANCKEVNGKLNGVGNITLSGKADKATLRRDGVGRIGHNHLECSNVTSTGVGL